MPTLRAIETALTAPGQPFEMEELEIRGVRTRVWKHAPRTLKDVLEASRAHGDATFLVYYEHRVTFTGHYRLASGLAHRLIDELGVRKGDRVAIACRNCTEWSVVFWAILATGAIAVPLNAWWTAEELRFGLEDSDARLVFADAERLIRLQELDEPPPRNTTIGINIRGRTDLRVPDGFSTLGELLEAVPDDVSQPEVEISPEDDATIFYTSGTTGRSKGAVGTHRNLCSVALCSQFLGARALQRSGQGAAPANGEVTTPPRVVAMMTTPLFHVTACLANLVVNTSVGSTIVMMRKWDPEDALALIERERVTGFGGVPSMVLQLLDSPSFATRDTSSLVRVGTGGAPAPPEQARRLTACLPSAIPGNAWGMTETSSVVTSISGLDYLAHPDSSGAPVPVDELKIIDDDWNDVAPGGAGELAVKGPNVIRGYWSRPQETAATIREGWLRTGDLARIDDEGWLYILDRTKDVIIRGGENIASLEIEAILFEHPAVADAAVIPIPHDVLGEEVGAVVEVRRDHSTDEAELRSWVTGRVAAYKVPARIWFWPESLPRNAAGKIMKRELRDAVLVES